VGELGRRNRVAYCSEQHNRDILVYRILLDLVAYGVPIFVRHHDIQDDQMRSFLLDLVQGLNTVICFGDPVVITGEFHGDRLHQIRVIINN
jgi:hypothetical protein